MLTVTPQVLCVSNKHCGFGLVGYDVAFTRRRSRVQLPELVLFSLKAFVAEWSKALDSSSSLSIEAGVRIPPDASQILALVAQLAERSAVNRQVAGSIPAGSVYFYYFLLFFYYFFIIFLLFWVDWLSTTPKVKFDDKSAKKHSVWGSNPQPPD